jgi:hypothetical protein
MSRRVSSSSRTLSVVISTSVMQTSYKCMTYVLHRFFKSLR